MKERFGPVGLRFDWISQISIDVLIVGIMVDQIAHYQGLIDNTFFTPWHVILYTGIAVVSFVHGIIWFINRMRGFSFKDALPPGYLLSIIGVFMLGFGGVFDMIWHTLFGVEFNTEALVSPSHFILFIGFMFVLTGPFRALWIRVSHPRPLTWRESLPGILSLAMGLLMLGSFSLFANPMGSMWADNQFASYLTNKIYIPGVAWSTNDFAMSLVLAGTIIQAIFTICLLVLVNERFKLPRGAWTVIYGISYTLLAAPYFQFRFIPAALALGVACDVVTEKVDMCTVSSTTLRWIGAGIPVFFYCVYYLLMSVSGGIAWKIHVWGGTIILAGCVGMATTYALRRPETLPVR